MNREKLTVLAIDDDHGDVEILRRCLEQIHEYDVTLVHADDVEIATRKLKETNVDIAFLDYQLGTSTGLELLEAFRASGDIRPVIALTGRGDMYVAANLTRAGADEFLSKADVSPETIVNAIHRANEAFAARIRNRDDRQKTERLTKIVAEMNVELSRASRFDPLTQILNRKAWEETVALQHDKCRRSKQPYCVLLIDIDYFKQVNDSLGHKAGDNCLCEVAKRIEQTCQATDYVGRYGGEEFVVLACQTDLGTGMNLGERIRKAIWKQMIPHPASIVADRVTVSVGVALGPRDTVDEVVNAADAAMYKAKAAGRNQVMSSM